MNLQSQWPACEAAHRGDALGRALRDGEEIGGVRRVGTEQAQRPCGAATGPTALWAFGDLSVTMHLTAGDSDIVRRWGLWVESRAGQDGLQGGPCRLDLSEGVGKGVTCLGVTSLGARDRCCVRVDKVALGCGATWTPMHASTETERLSRRWWVVGTGTSWPVGRRGRGGAGWTRRRQMGLETSAGVGVRLARSRGPACLEVCTGEPRAYFRPRQLRSRAAHTSEASSTVFSDSLLVETAGSERGQAAQERKLERLVVLPGSKEVSKKRASGNATPPQVRAHRSWLKGLRGVTGTRAARADEVLDHNPACSDSRCPRCWTEDSRTHKE